MIISIHFTEWSLHHCTRSYPTNKEKSLIERSNPLLPEVLAAAALNTVHLKFLDDLPSGAVKGSTALPIGSIKPL
jgi:hypothetical protein